MADLIDRRAAIDAIAGQSIFTVEEIYDKCNRYISDDTGWIGGLKDAIDAIKELPSAQQWIPVSERIPETQGDYLTTTILNEVHCDYWDGLNFQRTETVVAWMPLPEPWKGET